MAKYVRPPTSSSSSSSPSQVFAGGDPAFACVADQGIGAIGDLTAAIRSGNGSLV